MIMKTKAILLGTAALMFTLTSEKQLHKSALHTSTIRPLSWSVMVNIILSAQAEAD